MFGIRRKTALSRSAQLRLVSSPDGHLLLDIDQDRVLKLNPVGAEIWRLAGEGSSESQIVDELSGRYQVSKDKIARDVRSLLERLQALGVSPGSSTVAERGPTTSVANKASYPWYGQATVSKPSPRIFAISLAFVGLFVFDVILHVFSLKVLCWCVEACPILDRKFDAKTPGRACSAVEMATVWYPKQAVCFQRSAVTACLLRCYGVRARMMIGIRPLPLLAHSWVEISDAVVNDWRPVSQFYHTATSY